MDASLQKWSQGFMTSLKKCRKDRNLQQALHLHDDYISKHGSELFSSLGNQLVSLLVDVGSMCCAQKVFDRLSLPDESSWNSLIVGYAKLKDSNSALSLYQKMSKLDEPLHLSVPAFMALLKACTLLKNVKIGQILHAKINERGLLDFDVFIGCSLVDMYAKCGFIMKAQEVFDRLPVRDVVSWNSLISGYAEHGFCEEAFYYFERVRFDGISPNASTLGSCLKACIKADSMVKGQEIHAEIVKKGLERDILLGNTLVDMYTKCGSLPMAQYLFEKLPRRDVVSWNVLMAGYVEGGQGEKALHHFEQMESEEIGPTSVTFVCTLKACGTLGIVEKGKWVHIHIVKRGLEEEVLIGNSLVDMYMKCDSVADAQETFCKLPARDVISWTSLICGYMEHGYSEEALGYLEQMEHDFICPNSVSFVCGLKACGSVGFSDRGKILHSEIVRKGFEREGVIGNALIDMYSKCSLLLEAQDVFDKLPTQDLVSWTALVRGYVEHGYGVKAFDYLEKLQSMGILLDSVAIICNLKACIITSARSKGQGVHAEIIKKGFVESDTLIGSSLVDMYCRYGLLEDARKVFEKLPSRDIVSWSLLIAGCMDHGNCDDVLHCVEQMRHDGITINAAVFTCIVKACANIGDTICGQVTHAEIAKRGLEKDILICNTLLDMYSKCGLLEEANKTFYSLPNQDVVTWNCLLEVYINQARAEEALQHIVWMQQDGIALDPVVFASCLKACGSMRAIVKGQEMHADIVRKGFETEVFVSNNLIDMYARCGCLIMARNVLDCLADRDTISWNALLSAYVETRLWEEVIICTEQMQNEGILLNAVTYIYILKSCMCIGATMKGQKVYMEIVQKGHEQTSPIENMLIDMYAKAGCTGEAIQMFEKHPNFSVSSWNVLISGYVQLGESESVFHMVDRMIGKGITPNLATFVCVLNACSHAGVVHKGVMYFETMINAYGYIPGIEHYNCMVDLFGRADHLDMAKGLIEEMPLHPDIAVWHTLLGACQTWKNMDLGKHAFAHALGMDENGVAAYMFMLNMYTSVSLVDPETKC